MYSNTSFIMHTTLLYKDSSDGGSEQKRDVVLQNDATKNITAFSSEEKRVNAKGMGFAVW